MTFHDLVDQSLKTDIEELPLRAMGAVYQKMQHYLSIHERIAPVSRTDWGSNVVLTNINQIINVLQLPMYCEILYCFEKHPIFT